MASRHAEGVLLDSNLLLVLFVGYWDSELVGRAKGTQEYSAWDFDFLARLVSQERPLILTPHLLTEVDNLLGSRLGEYECAGCRSLMTNLLAHISESRSRAVELVEEPIFARLGLADASIARVARKRKCVVWTNDHPLYLSLAHQGISVRYYAHVRAALQANDQA